MMHLPSNTHDASAGPTTNRLLNAWHAGIALFQQKRWQKVGIYTMLIVAFTIWGLTDVRRRARVDNGRGIVHRTDVTVFTAAGAAFFEGGDPYSFTNVRGWRYPYPPMFALLMAPLAKLHSEHQALIWFAISVGMVWACYRECLKLLGLFSGWIGLCADQLPVWIYWGVGLTVTLPTLNCLQRGQVGVLKTWLLLWGFRLIAERRGWLRSLLGGIVLAAPIALKVTPLLPVSLVVLQQFLPALMRPCRKTCQPAVAVTSGLVVGLWLFLLQIPAVLIGWQANLGHLQVWHQRVAAMAGQVDPRGQVDTPYTMRNQSLTNAVYRSGNWFAHAFLGGPDDTQVDRMYSAPDGLPMDAPLVSTVLLVVRGGLLLLLLAVVVRTCRADDALGDVASFGLACAATLIISPLARAHYFMMLLPGVLFIPLWLLARGRTWAAIAAVVTPAALVTLHYLALDIAGRAGILGLGISIWYMAACLAMITSRSSQAISANLAISAETSPIALPRAA